MARHQVTLALAAGCGRIVVMAREYLPEMAELQRESERGGAAFHVLTGSRGLSPLVSAADEVLVLAEGLLPTTGDALRLIGTGQAVFLQPAESGIPAGFERIDLNHASAGLMLVPGRLVDRLMDLPPDADAGSALLRIALQAGVAQRPVPDEVRAGGRWLLVRTEAEAQAAEDGWMVRHTSGGPPTPGPLLARYLARRFGPAVLHANATGLLVPYGTGYLIALAGFGLAWFGLAWLGLVCIGFGCVLQRTAALLGRLQREALAVRLGSAWRSVVSAGVLDLLIVAILVLARAPLPGESLLERGFAPAVLMGLVRLLPRAFPAGWSAWLADRLLLCLLLALMAAGGVIAPGLLALVLLLLLAGLVLSHRNDGSGRSSALTRA
ncbi:hypothetical protein ACFOD9_08400 [Novosphingobium bradum]|uniref:Uncharacterized protein n=1 Tax=Novosphingobium bradum TaxID=1737444 RepID=A0ABV7INJ3_9SPHN